MSIEYDQIEGREFDWFAVDSLGHVGHFSTAGFGPVPVTLLQNLKRIESLPEEVLKLLPIKTNATGHLPGDISDWLEMAKRGIYSFDWKHWSGPYRRAATPAMSLTVSQLPHELAKLVRLVEFSTASFEVLREIRPEELCSCEQAQQAIPADRGEERRSR